MSFPRMPTPSPPPWEHQGLGSCILGWLDDAKIRDICQLPDSVRLVIALGYPGEKDAPRVKKRKSLEELATYMD